MIKKEDIKVGLKFVASCDNLFYTDLSPKKKNHVFTITGFEIHDNEVYVLTDYNDVFTMKAFLGASNRYKMFYPDEVVENEPVSENTDADCFKEITDKMCDIYKRKNSDYGNSFSKLFKKCGMTYAYGHLAEKIERIDSLRNNDAKVQGESMIDSLYDLANYAILTIMEIEKNKKEQEG